MQTTDDTNGTDNTDEEERRKESPKGTKKTMVKRKKEGRENDVIARTYDFFRSFFLFEQVRGDLLIL